VLISPPIRILALAATAALLAAAPSFATTIDADFDAETPSIASSDTVGANLQFISNSLRTSDSLAELVDDVSITPVPEATAATVFGTGTLTAGATCRQCASSALERRS